MTVLIACGLVREARWFAREGVEVVPGGGDEAALEAALDARAAGARAILSIGLAGGLAPRLRAGDLVIGTIAPTGSERREWSVGAGSTRRSPVRIADDARPGHQTEADRRWIDAVARLLPQAIVGRIHGSGAIVATTGEKHQLHLASRALACDMESHVAARVAARHRLPFAVVRAISDPADAALPPAALVAMQAGGELAIGAVLGSIASRPWQVPALLRLARDAARARQSLTTGYARLADAGFALPG